MTEHASLAGLPAVLTQVRAKPLFVMRLEVRKLLMVGQTPGGLRRIGVVPGGTFEGERISGEVLDSGTDWQTVMGDGSTRLDVRLMLRATDGATIMMRYQGIRHGPVDVISRLEDGEIVDPDRYYFRINPIFDAPTGPHEWLNRVIAVGIGHRLATGPVYSVFEVL